VCVSDSESVCVCVCVCVHEREYVLNDKRLALLDHRVVFCLCVCGVYV